MGRITDSYDADEEDRRHDADVQRELDERLDMEVRIAAAKKAASGISKEEHAILNAGNRGALAGGQDVAAGANPYQINTPEYDEWERRRSLASIAKHNRYRRSA